MTEEIWKTLDGYDYPYEVSNLGQVRGHYGLLTPHDCGTAATVCLQRNGRSYTKRVHTLVAQAFVPNPEGLIYVRHKDGDRMNCRADNLVWFAKKPEAKGYDLPMKTKVPKCPSNCIHYGRWDATTPCCDYFLNTGKRRPCPAGENCTVYKRGKRGKKALFHW